MVSCPATSEHGSDALLHHIRGEILWKRAAPVLPRFSSNSALRQPIPRLLARITHEELEQLFRGYGYTPYFVEGHEPQKMYDLMADTLDTVIGEIQRIQKEARRNGSSKRPRWPMIVLRTPKGWTCSKEIDGKRTEDYWRSHTPT